MVKGVGVWGQWEIKVPVQDNSQNEIENSLLTYPGPKYTLRFLTKCEVNQATGIKCESESIKVSSISFIFTNCHEI